MVFSGKALSMLYLYKTWNLSHTVVNIMHRQLRGKQEPTEKRQTYLLFPIIYILKPNFWFIYVSLSTLWTLTATLCLWSCCIKQTLSPIMSYFEGSRFFCKQLLLDFIFGKEYTMLFKGDFFFFEMNYFEESKVFCRQPLPVPHQ